MSHPVAVVGQKVYLSYMTDGKGHEDSTTLAKGAFYFTCLMNPYGSVQLALDHKGLGWEIATHGGMAAWAQYLL